MIDKPDLICAYHLDGKGNGRSIDWPEVKSWSPAAGAIWVHLDATHQNTESWLRDASGLDAFVIDGLLAEETRPRCDWYESGILLVLRGVNLNPEAEPEDMVSIRIWFDQHKVISTRIRKLMAVQDIREQLAAGNGPLSAPHLVARLAARLTERMGPVIEEISDDIADLEGRMVDEEAEAPPNLRDVRHKLIQRRRIAISLRRYISPQRDALNGLSLLESAWLDDRMRGRLRETVDRVTRITEELDEIRERSAVIQDELTGRVSQRMERTMYALTVVATIMLPLGFLTGLLGINVGGIPGAETSWAFWAVSAALAAVVAAEVWLFKRLKWL